MEYFNEVVIANYSISSTNCDVVVPAIYFLIRNVIQIKFSFDLVSRNCFAKRLIQIKIVNKLRVIKIVLQGTNTAKHILYRFALYLNQYFDL